MRKLKPGAETYLDVNAIHSISSYTYFWNSKYTHSCKDRKLHFCEKYSSKDLSNTDL